MFAGDELAPARVVLMSLTRTVPAAVPSVFHSSMPLVPSLPAKNATVPLTTTGEVVAERPLPFVAIVLMSLTRDCEWPAPASHRQQSASEETRSMVVLSWLSCGIRSDESEVPGRRPPAGVTKVVVLDRRTGAAQARTLAPAVNPQRSLAAPRSDPAVGQQLTHAAGARNNVVHVVEPALLLEERAGNALQHFLRRQAPVEPSGVDLDLGTVVRDAQDRLRPDHQMH